MLEWGWGSRNQVLDGDWVHFGLRADFCFVLDQVLKRDQASGIVLFAFLPQPNNLLQRKDSN